MSLTITVQAAATASSAVISNSLVPNVVGMARAAQRSADIEGGATCHVPRMEAPALYHGLKHRPSNRLVKVVLKQATVHITTNYELRTTNYDLCVLTALQITSLS